MAKKAIRVEKDISERWMLTYLDLITILMIFFVVLYAMSNVDALKYKQLSESLNSALSPEAVQAGGSGNTDSTGSAIEVKDNAKDISENLSDITDPELLEVAQKIKAMLHEKNIESEISVSVRERGIVVGLTNTILFDIGSSDIRSEGKKILLEIGGIAKTVDHYIRIEGNTDNMPIKTSRFPSNWELSVSRATEVVKFLILENGIEPEKISAVGYGEYRPGKPNTTPENRAFNRKVDIVILSSSLAGSESAHYIEK